MEKMFMLSLACALAVVHGSHSKSTTTTTYSSCIDLADGIYTFQLSADGPLVSGKCSHEYLILDYNRDPLIADYFSSFTKWHKFVAASVKNDHPNWQQWFEPAAQYASARYLVSPSCEECDASAEHQLYGRQTAYYMNSFGFTCFDPKRGVTACDADFFTQECNYCGWDETGQHLLTYPRDQLTQTWEDLVAADYGIGVCNFELRSAHQRVLDSFLQCTNEESAWKPTLGMNGAKCVCFQPVLTATAADINTDTDTDANTDADRGAKTKTETETETAADQASEESGAKNAAAVASMAAVAAAAATSAVLSSPPFFSALETREFSESQTDIAYKSKQEILDSVAALTLTLTAKSKSISNSNSNSNSNEGLRRYALYQSDFDAGTYRITAPGYYTIMEDIVFDFNGMSAAELASASVSPNDPALNYWWPTDAARYPGAGGFREAYFLGYFAGITVECADVVLDLNAHELKMSRAFFYQQPYFALIELSSQPFIPQQGPGIFGSDLRSASNAHIKNGRLGLSSHHAIHGNYVADVVISDVRVYDYFSHGIQLNGFNGVVLERIDIGANTDRALLNAGYSHLRLLLPNMLKLVEDLPPQSHIQLRGKEKYSMNYLLKKTVALMDEAFFYALNCDVSDDDEKSDSSSSSSSSSASRASKTECGSGSTLSDEASVFLNKNGRGINYGTVLYGLYLNYPGAGIFGWHSNNKYSYNAYVSDVRVHDLQHSGVEVIGGTYEGRAFANAFAAPLDFVELLGDRTAVLNFGSWSDPRTRPRKDKHYPYVGSIVSDMHFAFYKFGAQLNNFDYFPGIPYVGIHEELLHWAEGTEGYTTWMNTEQAVEIHLICNEDAMFHSGKGILGVKVSGVNNIEMSRVSVHDLHDYTPLGCAPELGSGDDNFFYHPGMPFYALSQQVPYQSGFSMNQIHGISLDHAVVNRFADIQVHNVMSHTGRVFGVAVWFSTEMHVELDAGDDDDDDLSGKYPIRISELRAAVDVDKELYEYESLPNRRSEVCAFRVIDDDTYPAVFMATDAIHAEVEVEMEDLAESVSVECIYGNVGCFGEENVYSSVGSVSNGRHCNSNSKKSKAFVGKMAHYVISLQHPFIHIFVFFLLVSLPLLYYFCYHSTKMATHNSIKINGRSQLNSKKFSEYRYSTF